MKDSTPTVLISARDYFKEAVEEACTRRNINTFPMAKQYLVDLLENYINASSLFATEDEQGHSRQETRAELLLKASSAPPAQKVDLLKKLGDTSLYVTGFFGDSLSRKVVDADYYVEMGVTAYSSLASFASEDTAKRVYKEYASRFVEFVDVLCFISQKSMIQDDRNLLRLYERYIRTGSTLAKEHLLERGLIPPMTKEIKEQ